MWSKRKGLRRGEHGEIKNSELQSGECWFSRAKEAKYQAYGNPLQVYLHGIFENCGSRRSVMASLPFKLV